MFTMNAAMGSQFAEVQGLYGPVHVTERVLQKIWLSRRFQTNGLQTEAGRRLDVLNPGRWNQFDGPDFREAVLRIDGREVIGDVELHFYERDWFAHGHERDPNFARVQLHVVLFPEQGEPAPAAGLSGPVPETLFWLPYLEQDLEAFIQEDASSGLDERERTDQADAVREVPESLRRYRFIEMARERWERKLRFAAQRIAHMGAEETLHQFFMETLGYARNRVPMASVALSWPLESLRAGTLPSAGALMDEQTGWKVSGIRPPNQPRRRIEQYLSFFAHDRQWPEAVLKALRRPLGADALERPTPAFRRTCRLNRLREAIATSILGGELGGTRLDTCFVDAILPTAAACHDNPDAFFPMWFHWFMGDMAEDIRAFLRESAICQPPRHPYANGWAQGALQYFLEARQAR